MHDSRARGCPDRLAPDHVWDGLFALIDCRDPVWYDFGQIATECCVAKFNRNETRFHDAKYPIVVNLRKCAPTRDRTSSEIFEEEVEVRPHDDAASDRIGFSSVPPLAKLPLPC